MALLLSQSGTPPAVPFVPYDDHPSRLFDKRASKQDGDPWHTFFVVPQPPPTRGWDDWDWDKDFTEKRLWFESEAQVGAPFLPPTNWFEESAAAVARSSGSLAAMVMLDEFVNAPSGGTAFGPAPRGRSVRLGFSISAFR
jgi:hypothetical protein